MEPEEKQPEEKQRGYLLVDREIGALLGTAVRAPGGSPPAPAQVQPASLDLRLGRAAWRIRSGFLPGPESIGDRLSDLAIARVEMDGRGAVFERGLAYLAEIEEELELPADVRARFNPRSSTGRCDVFTRVLCERHGRFDEAPKGYSGKLWIEISPLSFPVQLARGDRVCQMRLLRGRSALSQHELREICREIPIVCGQDGRALPLSQVRFDEEGGLLLSVGLAGRDPAGWRAAAHTDVVDFAKEGAHDAGDFWEPVHAPRGRCILAPGTFYLFASRERLRIPPELAAEMQPVDTGIGELRNNYAGFFDSGFGWREGPDGKPEGRGTPAVLEVRAHDVPFLIEDGQAMCRLRFHRMSGRPERLYGAGRASSYRDQDLTLARCFR
jgi:dCTP deaminase